MTMVIGLCGPAGSGKGEVAKLLSNFGKTYTLPFAKPLKAMAKSFGWDGNKDEKGRKFLQLLGTEIGRAYDQDYWVKRWAEEAKMILSAGVPGYPNILQYDILVADDTRFDNEADIIKSFGGFVVRLSGRKYDLGNNSTHASERGITESKIDFTIDNSGTIEDLSDKIFRLLEWIKSVETEATHHE